MKSIRQRHIFFLLACCFPIMAVAAYEAMSWKIGEGHAIRFQTDKVEGVFRQMEGEIAFDEGNLAASHFDVTVATASIETGIGLKNKHALGEGWFDAERYPQIHFESSSISKAAQGYETRGLLDLHGVQKEIVIPFTFVQDTFKGGFELNRLDYKLGGTDGLQGKVGRVLKIDISVPVER